MRRHLGVIGALIVAATVLGLLSYSFAILVGLPAEQRAAPLATIATGVALLAVAALTYLLQRRNFVALHNPSLGIHYKNPMMYSSPVVVPAEEATDVYAEYIMWNTGDVPILVWQPAIVVMPDLGPADLRKSLLIMEDPSFATRSAGLQRTHVLPILQP